MASSTNTPAVSVSPLRRLAATIGDFFVSVAKARSRSDQFEALNSKTDAQLAKMGIAREDIARHVFRDYLWR